MKVSTVSEMQAMDKAAIEEHAVPDLLLMENAGLAAISVIEEAMGIKEKKFVVFAGGGNNGGDGFVVARKIHSKGGAVKVFLLSDPGQYKGAAETNLKSLQTLPVELKRVESTESLRMSLYHCDAVVDALFGTGLHRDVEGLYAEMIDMINQSGKPVFSLDIPSGVHGDTGQVMGKAVEADVTITFGLPKAGNLLYPGYGLVGKLFVSHISFPPTLYNSDQIQVEENRPPELPPRPEAGHKGVFGDVLFIAGAATYYGAPYFPALSFLKAGGGYSRLAAPASMIPHLAGKGSEIVFVPQEETAAGSMASANAEGLLALSEKVDLVVLGPGLSLDPESQDLARTLAGRIEKPLLLDGDGLTALALEPQLLRNRKGATVLTPHPGEMSRLLGRTIAEIENNRIQSVKDAARDLNAVVVLKGAHSLIGTPDQRIFINMTGNSGMASAGSGDVLAGAVAALFGLGLSLGDAARGGVFVHGLAGDLAAQDLGEDGMTAHDIMEYLPLAVASVREGSTRCASPIKVVL